MDNQEKPGFFAANLPFLMRQKPGFWALLRFRQQHPRMLAYARRYVAGVKRFFARYTADEMTVLLNQSDLVVQSIEVVHAGTRDWLPFMSLARQA